MLIKHKNNPIINLNNVSNVFIDRKSNKVVFNMSHSVKLTDVITADYEYWTYTDINEIQEYLHKALTSSGFIEPNNIYNRYVNMSKVSSIKTDDRTFKVIYNLACTVTHPDDVKKIKAGMSIPLNKQRLTSDFVFIRFNSADEYYDYMDSLEAFISNDLIVM
jgi:hypothetical protein